MTGQPDIDRLAEKIAKELPNPSWAHAALDELVALAHDGAHTRDHLPAATQSKNRAHERAEAAEARADELQREVRTQDTLIERWMTTAEDEKARADELQRAALAGVQDDNKDSAAPSEQERDKLLRDITDVLRNATRNRYGQVEIPEWLVNELLARAEATDA